MNLNFIDRLKYYYIGAIVIMDSSSIKSFKVKLAKLNFIQDKILVMVKMIDILVVMDSYYTNYNHNFNIVAALYFEQNYLNIMVILEKMLMNFS